MATITLSSSFDFSSNYEWDWEVTQATETGITITDGVHKQTFTGAFAFSATGDVTGLVTATSFFYNNALVYKAEGLNADAVKMAAFVEAENDVQETYSWVLAGNDNITGSAQDDGLLGYGGDDAISGGGGNDLLIGGEGNDILDGGAGYDTVRYADKRSTYQVTRDEDGMWITSSTGDGLDLVKNVERIVFTDGAIGFDNTGIGGQAYRVYQAAFNRTPDAGGLGYWISAMDKGTSLNTIASGFVNSNEFREVYGSNPTNAEILMKFYQNVLHREPDQAGYDYWLKAMNDKIVSVPEVLAMISESTENKAALEAVITAGFEFTPYP